jgi:hypothetical protein
VNIILKYIIPIYIFPIYDLLILVYSYLDCNIWFRIRILLDLLRSLYWIYKNLYLYLLYSNSLQSITIIITFLSLFLSSSLSVNTPYISYPIICFFIFIISTTFDLDTEIAGRSASTIKLNRLYCLRYSKYFIYIPNICY